jgi:transposase InsO family protein
VTGSPRVTVTKGTRLVYDGGLWEVTEISGEGLLLRNALGAVRRAGAGHLLSQPGTRLLDAPGGEPAPVPDPVEGMLSRQEAEELAGLTGHIREMLTGYRHGNEVLALPGEPRPQYGPGTTRADRYQAKAAELGVAEVTVRRMARRFQDDGPEGLIDKRKRRRSDPLAGADPRWLDKARVVLGDRTEASKPTMDLVLEEVAAQLEAEFGRGEVPVPGKTRGLQMLREISRGTSAFGGTKAKRQIAGRPPAPYGKLRALRPGEYLILDTTRLDVFAMDPVSLRWVQAELTIAMDLYDRAITGLRLTPVSTKAVDVAAVLFEAVRPLPEPAAGWVSLQPGYHGMPGTIVIDAGKLADADGHPLLPSVAAETIVVDHGKVYLSDHVMSACARLGISVQPARPYQATDKAAVERFFRTLGEQLLVALPGYKGPDVYRRGSAPEQEAFYFLHELEQIIRQWIDRCYHRQPHNGLRIPEAPGLDLSPLEMFAHGVAQAGYLQVPARPDLAFDFLQVKWRTIQHYGVEVGGLRYDGRVLNYFRNRVSPYAGRHAGKWPLRLDPGDASRIWFQHPGNGTWHELRWEHADAIGSPFSSEALAHARQLATATQRFPDPKRALAGLLDEWGAGLASSKAERRMALRGTDDRLRLLLPSAESEDEPKDAVGDDDEDTEVDAPFPGEDVGGDQAPADFYGDAMETI